MGKLSVGRNTMPSDYIVVVRNNKDGTSTVYKRKPNAIGNNILTLEQVADVRKKYVTREWPQKRLARYYGVCSGTIQGILSGRTWHYREDDGLQDLIDEINHENKSTEKNTWRRTTPEDDIKIREKYASRNYSMRDLAKHYGVSYQTICNIVNFKQGRKKSCSDS